MSFKKVMCAALATVLVGAFAASASASDKKMSINLGHVAIETTPLGRGTEYFAQIVNEKTNGRTRFPFSRTPSSAATAK